MRPITPSLLALLVGLLVPAARAEEEAGSETTYRNAELGMRLEGPQGWKLTVDRKGVSPWSRLATFFDPDSDAEAVLSARERSVAGIEALRAQVEPEWRKDEDFSVASVRVLEGMGKAASIQIDATHVVRPPPTETSLAPPPITYQVQATYWLTSGYEVLLYAKARLADWGRVKPQVESLRGSLTLEGGRGPSVPEGLGAFVDESRGFSCRFPDGYAVHVPRRRNAVVSFEGVGATNPALTVYHFSWDGTPEADAQRLVAFYTDDLGGQASLTPADLAGRPAFLVTAEARIGGKDQHLRVLTVQRKSGELFRLQAVMSIDAEAQGTRVFEAWLKDFKLGAAPN